jgi:hypothetical protein
MRVRPCASDVLIEAFVRRVEDQLTESLAPAYLGVERLGVALAPHDLRPVARALPPAHPPSS